MPKTYTGKFTAICSFCKKKAELPAKGMASFIAAILKAGFTFGVRGEDVKIACPANDCQKDCKIFVEDGIIQPSLPGTEED